MLIPERHSQRADAFIGVQSGPLVVSNLAVAEFSSAMARRLRMQLFSADEARFALSAFDARIARTAVAEEVTPADVALAGSFLRRLDLPLRTLDALHIAIAQRLDAALVAFDQRMLESARALGVTVALP